MVFARTGPRPHRRPARAGAESAADPLRRTRRPGSPRAFVWTILAVAGLLLTVIAVDAWRKLETARAREREQQREVAERAQRVAAARKRPAPSPSPAAVASASPSPLEAVALLPGPGGGGDGESPARREPPPADGDLTPETTTREVVLAIEREARARPGDPSQRRRLARAHAALGERLRREGDLAAASLQLEQALAIDAGSDDTLLSLAAVRLARGDLRDAERVLGRVSARGRSSAAYHAYRAQVLYAGERIDDALAEIRLAQAISPSAELKAFEKRLERERTAGNDRSIESRRFQVVFQGGRNVAAARSVIEALERLYDDLARDYRTDDFTVTAVLYAAESYHRITGAPDWAAASFDGKIRVPIAGLERVDEELRRVLKHELAHAFIHRKGGRHVPRWLHEGLAQRSAGSRLSGLRLSPAERAEIARPGEPPGARLFYAQSLARVEYLFEKQGANRVLALLEELREGKPFADAFDRSTSSDWSRFLQDFERAAGSPP